MTEKEFETRFAKAFSSAISENELTELTQKAIAEHPDSITAAVKILTEYQLCVMRSVLKEFFLNNGQ